MQKESVLLPGEAVVAALITGIADTCVAGGRLAGNYKSFRLKVLHNTAVDPEVNPIAIPLRSCAQNQK